MDKPANRFYGEQRNPITPGKYGLINIGVVGQLHIEVDCDDLMDASQLREAAHLFVQLAEYLENNH